MNIAVGGKNRFL